MKAVILAGGREQGFAPLANRISKALLPVANVPLLGHLLQYLSRSGVTEAAVCLRADSQSEVEKAAARHAESVRVRWFSEALPVGTAGALRAARGWVGEEPFLVIAGIPFLDFPLERALAFHAAQGATATVILEPDRAAGGFAETVRIGPDGALHEIIVPYGQAQPTGRRTLGVYVLGPEVWDHIGQESYLDLKEQLIPRLVRAGRRVVGMPVPGVGVRVDTVADYLRLCHEFVSNGYMRWSVAERQDRLVRLGINVSVAEDARLQGPILVGAGSRVAGRALVEGPTVIGTACSLAPGSRVRASVLMAGAAVAAGGRLERCVLAPGCLVPVAGSFRDVVLLPAREARGVPVAIPIGAGPADRMAFAAAVQSGARAAETSWKAIVHRGLEMFGALAGLLLMAPFLGVAALAIKADSPGPVLFRQRRIGKAGRPFMMLKLRTMVADAEARQEQFVDRNEVDGPMFKIGDDPRITRVGGFLRRIRLDEVPQFLNVLQGDMSLVGPRPLAMQEMRCNPAWRDLRLRVKPGMTGLWQVESTRRNTFQDWIGADTRYVECRSLALDLRIFLRTLAEVCRSLFGSSPGAPAPR
jgi:lipopolysaccharide/colanic/teichoic acid biosynthesis glycosyltransferase/NDP-sugar pyrophosphorylase family protein